MHKRGRYAQNWSLEVIIALSVFVVIFVLASAFMFYLPQDRADELQGELRSVFVSLENDVELTDGANVNAEKVDELSDLSCDELRDLLQVSGAVCIHFESLDGSLVQLKDGSFGIGCEDIYFDNGFVCGEEVI